MPYHATRICSKRTAYQGAYCPRIMIGAMLVMQGVWNKPGVWNMEEFDPDPFMDALNRWGLPWVEDFHPTLVD